MKVKKRYIILIALIMFVIIMFYIFKRNNIEISDIFNKNNKLAAYTFQKNGECDAWIDISLITEADKVFSTSDFMVIEASNTNLKTSEGNTGYSGFAFIDMHGCAVKISDVTTPSSDNAQMCSKMKEYASSQGSLNYWGEYYNNFVSDNYCTEKIVIPKTPNPTCEELGGEYIEPSDAAKIALFDTTKNGKRYQIINAATTTLEGSGYESFAFLIDGCTAPLQDTIHGNGFATEYANNNEICSAMRYYVTDKRSKEDINNWNYWAKIYNTYTDKEVRADGSEIIYDICPDSTLIKEKKEIECDTATRTEIISDNDINQAKKYNTICSEESGYQEIEFVTITLNWQGGWGPHTLGENVEWSGSDGIYSIQSIANQTLTITFDTNLKYYNNNHTGWSTTADCSTTTGSVVGLTNSFPASSSNTTYYACYDGYIYEGDLFNADGSKKTGFGEIVYETTTCDNAVITNNQVQMKQMSKYVKQSNQTITLDPILFEENKYCNVMCTDTVDVYYPNIFETVPAGQYFELMYEPEIKASRSCQTEFRYGNEYTPGTWVYDYIQAINNELTKLNALNKAKENLKAASNLPSCSAGACSDNADTLNVDGSICSGCGDCIEWKSSASKTNTYYHTDYPFKINADPQSVSYTSTDNASDAKNKCETVKKGELIATRTADFQTAETEYENAVRDRIRFEQFNLQCYAALDSDQNNDVDIKYNDTLNIAGGNYPIIDSSFTYKTKTAKVNIEETRYGTKGDYIGSIVDNTSIEEDDLKRVLVITPKSTKEFYIINPNLNFKYNTGEQLPSGVDEREEDLLVEGHVKNDTGSYSSIDESNNYIKNSDKEDNLYEKKFHLDGTKSTYIYFEPYTATKTYRKVEYYFTFHEATEYCSKVPSGEIIEGITCEGLYSSLSKSSEYTNKSGNKIPLKNNVYPVSLNAVNNKYPVKFTLTDTEYSGFIGEYTCNYEITNDALTLANEAPKLVENLKSNTIFRSVAPNEIDPNEREDTGNLGENWINAKGSAVRKAIEQKEEHSSSTKDTYNPANLEYSFTLTPTIIQKIKEYNNVSHRTYDDFELTCETEDKRECTSDFLTDLSQGKVDGVTAISNYSSINSWGIDKLTAIRKEWKYYILSFDNTTLNNSICESLGNNLYACQQGKMTLNNYNKLYERWDVLP